MALSSVSIKVVLVFGLEALFRSSGILMGIKCSKFLVKLLLLKLFLKVRISITKCAQNDLKTCPSRQN